MALEHIDETFYSKFELDFFFSHWPNPLTIIYKGKTEKTIALRCPKDEWLSSLLSNVGYPIFSTSVNISGQASMEKIEIIKKTFEKDVSLIVDAGDIKGKSSTILDVSERPFKVLRLGSYPINFDAISQEH